MNDNQNKSPQGMEPYAGQQLNAHPADGVEATQQMPPAQSVQDVQASYQQPAVTYGHTQAEAADPAHSYQQPAYSTAANAAHAAAYQTGAGADAGVAAGQKASKGSTGAKTFLIAFAGALVACILAMGIGFGFDLFNGGKAVNLGASTSTSVEAVEEETSLAEAVANKCLPSVVSIDVYGTNNSSSGNSIYDYLYGYNNSNSDELTEVGLGSGVILSDDGYIVTNYHVIEGGEQFKVTIEGESYEAELVGSEASSDVAVIKVKDGSGFKAIELGDSDDIKVGEWVMSLGSPFGLEQSVATGIVSATSRSQIMDSNEGSGSPTIYPNMIQTDAAINPGNSGGALVNSNGALIGLNTLITSYSGNYSGVGFAIPVNYAINIAQSIIAGEEPTHAQLGITMTTINPSIAQRYGFKANEGAYVSSVVEGSAAAQAGMQVGDIITAFDGQKVSSASDVMLDVRTKNPGDVVTVTVDRDGETKDLQVTLGTAQADSNQSDEPSNSQQKGDNSGGNSGRSPLDELFGL